MRENNGYCFLLLIEWLTCLRVEFENVLYSRDLKMVLIFLVTKVFKKGTVKRLPGSSCQYDVMSRFGDFSKWRAKSLLMRRIK